MKIGSNKRLTISPSLNSSNEVEITVDKRCLDGLSDVATWIDREEAKRIVKHLCDVFGIER